MRSSRSTARNGEAEIVGETLRRHGYAVEQAIGPERKALDVMTALYQKSYRIVHIAAHGDVRTARTSTAARAAASCCPTVCCSAPPRSSQMEIVPDLVFLNCCHLGKD